MTMIHIGDYELTDADRQAEASSALRALELGWNHAEVTGESMQLEDGAVCASRVVFYCLQEAMHTSEVEGSLRELQRRPVNRRETLAACKYFREQRELHVDPSALVCALGCELPDRWKQPRALVFSSRSGVYSLSPHRSDFQWPAGTIILAA